MISNFNNHFAKIIKSPKIKNRFILGLSGGIDSMALLHLLRNFIDNNKKIKIDLIPIIVDHNLRCESEKEAKEVKKISESLGFNAQIKKITEPKPNGNIQNWARKQRRNFLCNACMDKSANLILAHHFDDQAETLFMRLIKKTGLDGLSGMSAVSTWNGIFILRPLLNNNKDQIKNYVQSKHIKYFEDISNFNFKFERVKTRFLLENIKKQLWPNIAYDLNYLGHLNRNLLIKTSSIFDCWIKKNISINPGGAVRVDYKSLKNIFDKSYHFSTRVVGKIIQTVGGSEYPPKRKKTFELIYSIFCSQLKKKNLGNVNILHSMDYLFFFRESRNINFELNIESNKYHVFDGRFLVLSSISGKLIKCTESEFVPIYHKKPFKKYDKQINNTIPYLKTLEGKTIKPHLSIINQNSELKNNLKQHCFSLYLINRILV